MTKEEINNIFIKKVNNLKSLYEVEKFLNSKECKDYLINLQKIKLRGHPSKTLTKYEKERINYYDITYDDIQNITFKLSDFTLTQKKDSWG